MLEKKQGYRENRIARNLLEAFPWIIQLETQMWTDFYNAFLSATTKSSHNNFISLCNKGAILWSQMLGYI